MSDIETLLANVYDADLKGKKAPALAVLQTALANDAALKALARMRCQELDDLIATRGEQACAFSTRYWAYLTEVLA